MIKVHELAINEAPASTARKLVGGLLAGVRQVFI